MKVKSDLTERRNKDIMADWLKISAKKSTVDTLAALEKKYYLKDNTILKIIKKGNNGKF